MPLTFAETPLYYKDAQGNYHRILSGADMTGYRTAAAQDVIDAAQDAELNAVKNDVAWKLLWTNPDPSVAFPGQTISLDLSNCTEFVIKVYQWKDDGGIGGQVFILGYAVYNYSIITPILSDGQVYLAARRIATKANGVEISNGGSKTSLDGNFIPDNGWLVPVEIWAR